MTTFADLDFRGDLIEFGEPFVGVDYPAFTYLHSTDSKNKPLCADKGGRHLGEAVPGVAVAFPTKRHGLQHKHFGLGVFCGDDGGELGEPFAYAKCVSLTAEARAKEWLVGALIGDTILFNGKRYLIAGAPNENIKLIEVEN